MSKLYLKKSKTFLERSGEDYAVTKFRSGKFGWIVTPNRRENKKNQMRRKTEIEIEFSETIAYSRPNERFETFCPNCKSLVEMATPPIAAILTHSTEREIYRLVETSAIHFVETDRVLICLNSLNDFRKHQKPPDS